MPVLNLCSTSVSPLMKVITSWWFFRKTFAGLCLFRSLNEMLQQQKKKVWGKLDDNRLIHWRIDRMRVFWIGKVPPPSPAASRRTVHDPPPNYGWKCVWPHISCLNVLNIYNTWIFVLILALFFGVFFMFCIGNPQWIIQQSCFHTLPNVSMCV